VVDSPRLEGVVTMFWQNRKVLAAGHTGLRRAGSSFGSSGWRADICGLALQPPTIPNLFEEPT